MNKDLLKQFTDEMASKGIEALLPQNLSDRWLNLLLQEAEVFKNGGDGGIAGLVWSVANICIYLQRDSVVEDVRDGIESEELFDCIRCYIAALAAEKMGRSTDIYEENPPTLENIFDSDRVSKFKRRPAKNDILLKQFTDEMSRKPAAALLPRNLSDRWLDLLLEEADALFADKEDEPKPNETDGAPGLLFCVLKILHGRHKGLHRKPKPINIEEKKLLEYIETYAMSLRLERISRQTDMKVKDTSTLENIFNPDRPMSFTRVQDA